MQTFLKFAAAISALFLVGFICYRLIDERLRNDPNWIKELGPTALGIACFTSGFPVPTLFTAATMAAGFALGLGQGLLIAVPTCLAGMMACFEITRRWGREAAQGYVAKYVPDLVGLASRQQRLGIVLIRVLPVPFSFQNLFWASCTDVSSMDFGLFSSVIVIPHVSLMVYVGASSKSLADAISRKPSAAFPIALTLCVIVVLVAVVTRYVRRAVAETQGLRADHEV